MKYSWTLKKLVSSNHPPMLFLNSPTNRYLHLLTATDDAEGDAEEGEISYNHLRDIVELGEPHNVRPSVSLKEHRYSPRRLGVEFNMNKGPIQFKRPVWIATQPPLATSRGVALAGICVDCGGKGIFLDSGTWLLSYTEDWSEEEDHAREQAAKLAAVLCGKDLKVDVSYDKGVSAFHFKSDTGCLVGNFWGVEGWDLTWHTGECPKGCGGYINSGSIYTRKG
jgi:hypothetical protein